MPEIDTNEFVEPDDLRIWNKYTGELIGTLEQDTVEQAAAKLEVAASAAPSAAQIPRHRRADILNTAAESLQTHADEVAELIVAEAGKTIRQARKEVSRAANTLKLSANAALDNPGEVIAFDTFPGAEGRRGWYTREPLGLVVAITPYNDALNLVAHKLGPAIAAGNSVVLKPSQQTPLTAQFLVDILLRSGLPEQAIQVVRGNRDVVRMLVSSRKVRMVSFTGGFATGEAIAKLAGIKRLSMELGGNAPVLVFDDADLTQAAEACASGGFWAAGQNCIGAQRILVDKSVFFPFLQELVTVTKHLEVGDPRLEKTDIGPMISTSAAIGARRSIDEAVKAGARLISGGEQKESLLSPAILIKVPRTCRLWKEEVFAPVVLLEPFESEAEAVAAANDSEYSLQAGLFTSDINRAFRVAESIEAGGVMINDSSDFRLDSMPFGGAKYGSMGREGVRFTVEEMTQPKVVAIAGQ
ncbi:aldehyde dehydrogenase family protein [Brevibacterium zhoupengii]|uniref:aldehyde dehydrogenase family protein n=1 Tax=Brevibacterium zhoupengii TaxID=2898795 RepID=UPI001E381A71|nr:aldehyde dehydrogenase family protein [Brevibacterium zhoupengii]